jgi:MFS transporter, ACS family, pantothenate transporter
MCISEHPQDLDRSNVSNAYVSGMKEELNVSHESSRNQHTLMSVDARNGLQQDKYTLHVWLHSWDDTKYVLSQLCIPTVLTCMYTDNLALQRVAPRIWLPTMQIIWGLLTIW